MKQAEEEAANQYNSARELLLAEAVATVLLIGAAAGIWMSLSISRGLNRAVTLANAVAGGDLNQKGETQSNDEIKDLITALNSMVEKLRDVVSDALNASEQRLLGQPGNFGQRRAIVVGRHGAGGGGRGSFLVHGADGGQHQAERRQCRPDREDSPPSARRAGERRGRRPRGHAMQTIAEKISFVQEIARQTDLLALNAAVEAPGPASTAVASPWSLPKCGSSPSAARRRRRDRRAFGPDRVGGPRGGRDAD